MKNISAVLIAAALFLSTHAFAQEVKNTADGMDEPILKMKEAKDRQGYFDACKYALERCRVYNDYERLAGELHSLTAKQEGTPSADIHHYMIARTRLEELSCLARKNDIESGRIYMSVNEKYYNEALESLLKADSLTKSSDLSLDIYFLKFCIFKELFQRPKADAAFNDIVTKITSYSSDKAKNLAKLYEVSRTFRDKGMSDYAMNLKFVYASKVDLESAKMLAEDIKANADKYLEEGDVKESLSTYDTYLELAGNYYDQDAMAAKLMEIAEKYFNKRRYKDAVKYYSMYLSKYGSSKVADYASYQLALSYYNYKDYASALSKLTDFLKTYQNSVLFEKAFEELCRVYYETLPADKAMEELRKLIDAYPRRDTRDYAYLITAILYYSRPDYTKALEVLKNMQKEFPKSAYFYTSDMLITDINEIKKGAAQSYSFALKDVYRSWEAYLPISAVVTVTDGAEFLENKDAKGGGTSARTKCGSNVTFALAKLEDLDSFNEYWQDKEDRSRLPREVKTGTEKDLLSLAWSCADNGKFLDDRQTPSKAWQAPDMPGEYVVSVTASDLALIKNPDSGTRKDPAQTFSIHVTVEK